MTREEIQATRARLDASTRHITYKLEPRNAVKTARFCLDVLAGYLDGTVEETAAAARHAELTKTMEALRVEVERHPPPTPLLREAVTTGEFLPLPQLAQLGVPLSRRRNVTRVRNRFDKITGKKY